MDKLFFMKKELEELWGSISYYERVHNIDSSKLVAYYNLLKNFIEYGKKYFDDSSLTYEQIDDNMNKCAIDIIRKILFNSNEDILDNLSELSDLERYLLEKLEYCLNLKEYYERDFIAADLYANDRKYLAQFSDEDIIRFKNFQNFIRINSSHNDNKLK